MRFWWCLFLLPTMAMAKTESWPRLYNNGVTAYESNDFARAAALFENASASQDRGLQQRALYNLGNTSYRLGQARPAQAQQLWQRAVKSYETALAIDPKDADAKFNHDFVKKKLEELKQQQQQQKQDQKNQEDKKQDQKKDDQQQQQKSEDKQSEQQQSKPKSSQDQQKQEQQKKDEQQEEQQQAKQEKPAEPEQQPPETGGEASKDQDKMQAAAMLDDLRENEQNWNFFPEVQMKDLKDAGPPAKDW